MMALSVNVPSEIFESSKDDIDLEDGEIEDDEEEAVKTPTPVVEKVVASPKKAPAPKLEPPIIEASAVDSAKLLVSKNKDAKVKESKSKQSKVKESKKHSKKHSSKSSKQSQKLVEPSKSKQKVESVEDDWADNVEKAIRAAMGKDPNAVVEPKLLREETLPSVVIPEFGTEEDKIADLSGDDKKSRKKKRKKKHRDEDGDERKESKRRKKHHHKGEMDENLEGEDDDEMLFVRGASPVNIYRKEKRHGSQSPPVYHDDPYLYADDGTGQFDEQLYDSYEDDSELEDYLHDIEGGSRRGRGMKRRGRGGTIRGMMRKGMIRPRDLLALKKRKRLLLQRHPEQRPDSVCMFFMQGKCQKGEDCPYSHDALPPRKMELCKFYLMDCCAKKDKCLYMHHDFPCKFHHTGLKCYAGDRCKFSHRPLNDILKNILLRHLETAPKEILGDFPRLSREGAAAMVHNKKSRDHTTSSPPSTTPTSRPIPSLFDIEVPVPAQFMPGEGGTSPARKTTPMPSDNEDQDVNSAESPTSKECRSPSKRNKNRWDDSEETNDKPSRHDQNKQHWDDEIRKHQVDDGEGTPRWNTEGKQRSEADNRWSNERKRRDDADGHWNDNKQREGGDNCWNNDRKQRDDGDNRWNNERKQRDDGDNRWNNDSKQHNDGDNRWNNENRRDDGEHHWNENKLRVDGDNRWSNESKQRGLDADNHWNNENKHDDGEKKKRRGDKEKKPRWEDGDDGHNRRRDVPRDEDRRKWEGDERRSKKRALQDKSDRFGDNEGYGEDPADHMKPMTRCYKDGSSSQSQRLLKLAGYSSPQSSAPRPLDLDTDAEDKDDLVMDIDDHDPTGRKESVDESALVIDTQDENRQLHPSDNTGESSDSPVIPLHIQKLPKKQQELFIRIQQQQREQENNQGASTVEDKEEDRQEESWYSSDDDETEETSLSDVLKKLSASKVSQPDPDLAKKVTDLTKVPDVSDAVNKLLSSIGMRSQPENKTEKTKSSSTLPVLPLPPQPLPQQPALGPRDPRLSRDPRNRQGSSETRVSQDSPTPGSSSSSSSRVDPRARRRSSASRSIYDSISLSGPDKPSDSSVIRGDTDLRGFPPNSRDVDLRPNNKDLDLRTGYGDLDFRVGLDHRGVMSPLSSGLLTTKPDSDTDLRRMLGGLPFKPVPQHTAATEIDGSLNSHPPIPYKVAVVSIPTPDYSRLKVSSTDQLVRVDPRLRKLFKITSSSPASPPLAAPTLVSPTPSSSGSIPSTRADPRRLASQSRSSVPEGQDASQPDPNYNLRNTNEMMNSDPFAVQNNNLLNQQGQFVRNDLMANPMLLQQPMLPTMGLQMQNMDPRMFRPSGPQTPGLLGDAPFYPPSMPHYEEADGEQRGYYQANKRMGNTMEMQEWEQQQMMEEQHRSFRDNNTRGNWRGQTRRPTNTRYQYDKRNDSRSNRAYTPPQM